MRKKCRYADIPIEKKKKHIDEIPKQEKKKKVNEIVRVPRDVKALTQGTEHTRRIKFNIYVYIYITAKCKVIVKTNNLN